MRRRPGFGALGRWSGPLALVMVAAFTLGCMGTSLPGEEGDATPEEGSSKKLSLRDDLEGGCFGRPGKAYSPSNHTEDQVFVEKGERAWEFELKDVDGRTHQLSELLATKPVLLVTGSYTCPVYQKNRSKVDDLEGMFGDDIHVVLVYGPEAHPETDPSPYRGDPWPKLDKFSTVEEPRTYAERVDHAKMLRGSDDVLTLVEPLDNPVWCTYGTAPNAAYLIDQDGTFYAVHEWFDGKTMAQSIAALTGFEGDLRDERPGSGGGKGGRKKSRR